MDRRLQWTLVGVGVLLLVLSAELPPRHRLMLLVVYGAACYGLYAWQTAPKPRVAAAPPPPRDFEIPNEAELREIEALSHDDARSRVESRLANTEIWKRMEMPEDAYRRMKALTPTQQTFFRAHGGLGAAFGGAKMGADEIRAFKWPAATLLPFGSESNPQTGAQSQPFMRIGVDFDGNPILAKKDEETIYIVHGTRSSADKWWCANYPSLFHWILVAEVQLRS